MSADPSAPATMLEKARTVFPGVLACAVVAVAAQFLSEHYGAPAMLMALLIGIAFHFLSEEGSCPRGIAFSSKTVLRVAVALLGARISVDLLVDLGADLIVVVILGVFFTILVGLAFARLLGHGWRLALLTGGSVAICGASAAVAIAAVLPQNEHSERNLVFTVMGVTVLSTFAMVLYPVLVQGFALNDRIGGVFLGASIHDVAQVVGAGFSISTESGDTATLVKLMRVAMLAPVVLVISLAVRRHHDTGADQKKPPLIPAFVLGFLVLATLNSLHGIPEAVTEALSVASKWGLLMAIAGVGMKTSLKTIKSVGRTAIILIVAETIFIAVFAMVGITLFG